MRNPGNLLLLLLPLMAVLLLASPWGESLMLPCPFHKLTGFLCPLCGGQRMLRYMAQGEFSDAFCCNPLLFCMVPLAVLWYVARLSPAFARRSGIGALFGSSAQLLYLFVIIIWAVVRNMNFFY